MKPTLEEREELRRRVLDARSRCTFTNARIAEATGVDPGQVSKICRGRFETVSDSLMKICNLLGIGAELGAASPDLARIEVAAERTQRAAAWRRLERSVRRAWDKTPEGAARLARVLDAVAEARRR
jgi:transcriptional regulator with XRE-family HTH domain